MSWIMLGGVFLAYPWFCFIHTMPPSVLTQLHTTHEFFNDVGISTLHTRVNIRTC